MTEFMHLLGTEDVQRAANNMSEAAQQMKYAANLIDEAQRRHQQFLDDWLMRFEEALARKEGQAP